MALFTVGWLIGIGAERVAEVKTKWISPESWVDDGDVFFGNGFRIVVVFFVEAFFKGVIHGVDGGFAIFITFESVEVAFLDEEKNQK